MAADAHDKHELRWIVKQQGVSSNLGRHGLFVDDQILDDLLVPLQLPVGLVQPQPQVEQLPPLLASHLTVLHLTKQKNFKVTDKREAVYNRRE